MVCEKEGGAGYCIRLRRTSARTWGFESLALRLMPLFTVYILYSDSFDQSYVGQTKELEARFRRHNDGYVRSTKRYRPWRLIHQEQYNTRREAMKRERWLKSGIGREWIKQLIGKNNE